MCECVSVKCDGCLCVCCRRYGAGRALKSAKVCKLIQVILCIQKYWQALNLVILPKNYPIKF